MKIYNSLPEWIRWIVFFPLSFFGTGIFLLLVSSTYSRFNDNPITQYIDIASKSSFFIVIFLYAIFYTAPRYKLAVTRIVLILWELVGIFFLAGTLYAFLKHGIAFFHELKAEEWFQAIGFFVSMFVAWFVYLAIKKSN